jgi:hypothetical protein
MLLEKILATLTLIATHEIKSRTLHERDYHDYIMFIQS